MVSCCILCDTVPYEMCCALAIMYLLTVFSCYGDHRDLHVLTHSCPTRRSSDLHDAFDGRQQAAVVDFAVELSHLGLGGAYGCLQCADRSEEHTSELQSLMRISYAVFCLKKKKQVNVQVLKARLINITL